MNDAQKQNTCNEKIHYLRRDELPLSCPTPEMSLWNAHPKVYLPIEVSGREVCPYCGTEYILDPKAD